MMVRSPNRSLERRQRVRMAIGIGPDLHPDGLDLLRGVDHGREDLASGEAFVGYDRLMEQGRQAVAARERAQPYAGDVVPPDYAHEMGRRGRRRRSRRPDARDAQTALRGPRRIAVVFTFESIKKKDAPHFDTYGSGQVSFRIASVIGVSKIDDHTVEFETNKPTSFVPYQLCYMLIVSPTQWQKFKDWRQFAEQPSGTGPFRVTKFVPRERLELEANKTYWDAKRRPKIDKLVLLPMPEPTTRLAALRSGQVDWIEVPPPDSIPQLKGAGFTIALNSYPHNWTHTLRLDKEPWNSKLVRKAANYAIDRVGICKSLLNDTCIPATGVVYKGHPWFGKPKEIYDYNPAKARELLRQAGFDASKHPAKAVHLISTSGSGQMLPLAMNELIQKNLKDVGIDVDLQPVEWNTLLTRWRAGFRTPENEGLNAWNISWNFLEPWSGFGRFFHSKSVVPVAVNTMPYINPEADKLIDEAEPTFDTNKQNELLARLHEIIVDDAPWLFVVHDQNPRALSSKVKGFVQPQSWFVDLTSVTVR
ncbi:MAG TPA: ABC transporter substrate-binding protein [Candidatus Methylomirabilis sp.]|nr:ABC transporter substrate-binding protein [Candidatus Methylomirabilis sp.]